MLRSVKEHQIGIHQCVVDLGSSGCCRGVGGGGEPSRVVGIEVTQDEEATLGLEEQVYGGGETGKAGGRGGKCRC